MKQAELFDPVPAEVQEQIIASLLPIYEEYKRIGWPGMAQNLIGRRSKINHHAIARIIGYGVAKQDASALVYDLNTQAYRRVFGSTATNR